MHSRQSGETGRGAARDLLPFSPPTLAEQDALRRAAAYLRRAGNEVATRALMPDLAAAPGWAAGGDGGGGARAGFAALQDSLRAAASLCAGVIETAGDETGRRDGGTAGERTAPSPAVRGGEVAR